MSQAPWMQALIAGMWGGFVALERKAFLQAMLSRPLVAATGLGLLLHDVESGVKIGMVLELFYLGSANLGASVPEHDTLVATGTTAAAAAMASGSGLGSTPPLWSVSLLAFIWLGRLGRRVDRALEGHSSSLAARAQLVAEQGNLTRAMRQHLWGMWPNFAIFGALTAMCSLAGYAAAPLVARIPPAGVRGLAWVFPAVASVAAAVAARGSHARNAAGYATTAAALVAGFALLVGWGWRP